MHKETAMIWLGGDMFYDKFHGYIKDVKFYFDTIVSEGTRLCNTDEYCDSCSSTGECLKCKSGYK